MATLVGTKTPSAKPRRHQSGLGIGKAKLSRAYDCIKADLPDDLLPDILGYQDLRPSINQIFLDVLKNVRAGYQPGEELTIAGNGSPNSSAGQSCCKNIGERAGPALEANSGRASQHLDPLHRRCSASYSN